MPDETVRVNITHVARMGKAWKIDGADDGGNVRTYTMHENDRDSGAPSQPPNVGELVLFVYGTQTGEFQGKQQTTYWINEVRMAQPRNGTGPPQTPFHGNMPDATAPPQESPEPKKPPQTSSFENLINASIEWQVCVKEAAASLRANLEWCVAGQHDANVRLPITGDQIAAMARDIFYGKDYPQHEELPLSTQEQGEPERQFTG